MSLYFAGKITNMDNGTSPITPIIGHVKCNASHTLLIELVRHSPEFLRILSPAPATFLTIPPSPDYTVCVYWRMRTYQRLCTFRRPPSPTVGVTHSIHPSNPSAHWPWLLLSHNYLMSTFGFGVNRLYDPAICAI